MRIGHTTQRTVLHLGGLLPECDLAQAAASPRPGTDIAGRAGNPFGHSDAGRPCAVGRWKGTGDAALHPTGSRTSAGLGEIGLGVAAATAAAHTPGASSNSPKRPRDELKNVVATFWIVALQINDLRYRPPLNHEISVKPWSTSCPPFSHTDEPPFRNCGTGPPPAAPSP